MMSVSDDQAPSPTLNERSNKFWSDLAAELTSRGRKVDRTDVGTVSRVDGVHTWIRVAESRKTTSGRFRVGKPTGKLYVSFNIDGGRGYTSPEGKNGFNLKKVADALCDQVDQKIAVDARDCEQKELKARSQTLVDEINSEFGLDYYSGLRADRHMTGELFITGDLTAEEIRAALKLIQGMRKP